MTMHDDKPEIQTNWLTRFWRFLTDAHPSVTDIGERRRAQLLSALSLILVIAFTAAVLSNPQSVTVFIIFLGLTLAAYIVSRTRFFKIGAYLFSFGFTSIAYITLFNGSANSVDTALSSIVPIALILASAILSQRGFFILVIATVTATGSIQVYADPKYINDPSFSFGRTVGTITSTGIILVGITAFRTSVERARLKEVEDINTELEDLTSNLEQRVNERTAELEAANQRTSQRAAQLQAITELSEAIAELDDLSELFTAVTNLISERFGFYHVGIFLVDSEKEFAVLQSANSEGGKTMLARGHRLALGTGVVGYSAQTGQPRIALDVGADAVFFDNPDLPNTRSEVALPLKSRDDIVGVLDVQSTQPGAFSNEDLQVLTTLANQVSIAFENTRLLSDTRAALDQVQEVYNEFTRTEWSRAVSIAEQPGFRYQSGRIEILEDALQSPDVVAAVENGRIVVSQVNGSEEKRGTTLAVPVKLREQVIGVLHIESDNSSHEWNEDEVSLVQAVAERAAIALENARLFQDARRRASKEQLISEASARIGSALDLENILQTTAEELERVLGGSEVLIQFQNKEAQS
ncbi:MAG TPA: GAF domain-containing protein [Anaerolineales bacterium]|nr:GAF domain-containing protein [Anaerolineales bacterium]